MTMEIMLCHRDGYCLARNNFRLYLNLDSGRMMFMPQGMDQLLGAIELPWIPQMAGLVARAVIETPQGKSRYTEEFRSLFKTLFKPEVLAHRVDQLTESLRPGLSATEFENVRAQALLLKDRIIARAHNLELQLTQLPLPPLTFTNGVGLLENWRKSDETGSGQLDLVKSGRSPCLHIVTSSDTSASWRTKALLTTGHYRFEGKVRVSDVRPLGFGTHQGAGLRIGGQTRQSNDLTGSSDWHLLAETFEVGQTNQEVEFVCELRASRGEAWFDCASLRIVQEP